MGEFFSFLQNNLADFWTYTGFHNATTGHLVMILIGIFFIYLAVAKEFEPMLLIPIGFGMLIGNIPFNMEAGLKVGIYEEGSVLNILYQEGHILAFGFNVIATSRNSLSKNGTRPSTPQADKLLLARRQSYMCNLESLRTVSS